MSTKIGPLHILSRRDSLKIKRHTKTKSKAMEKDVSQMWDAFFILGMFQ